MSVVFSTGHKESLSAQTRPRPRHREGANGRERVWFESRDLMEIKFLIALLPCLYENQFLDRVPFLLKYREGRSLVLRHL